jgi:hypothetical protein
LAKVFVNVFDDGVRFVARKKEAEEFTLKSVSIVMDGSRQEYSR